MERLKRSIGVREQRDSRLHGAESLTDALWDADDVGPDEPVLMLSFEGHLYELNTASAVMWELLQSSRSVPELEQGLSAFFGVAEDEVAGDVAAFVAELRRLRLITECV